ncbi:MAG: alpha/beta fold hydrolase [Treponema sp.]|nr:alpha/beta fold hydrolase [Treponema sp.]
MALDNQITILSHGFNKSHDDMSYLSDGLNKHGVNNFAVNLPITFKSLDDCLGPLDLQICDIIKKYEAINFVGHSMGGLIIRAYINKFEPANVGRCVFIATPHHGSHLAKVSGHIPFYNDIFKPLKSLQPSAENKYLLKSNIEIGLIAGSRNNTIFGKIFLSAESDGRVEISSALSGDAKDAIVLPYGHKEIHHKEETLMQVRNFLWHGTFDKGSRDVTGCQHRCFG